MIALSGVRSSWRHVRQELRLVLAGDLELAALLLELLEQAGVLDRQHRLAGERLEQLDDLWRELARRLAADHDQHADDRSSRRSGTASRARMPGAEQASAQTARR